ncbi:rcc01693 family protein [Hansschlegelia quercus]|uniref:Phage tail assembly chaperone n=1 Tax=Hansschlegelia quercus TaxID=2528245 RepID=A0A4Q9GF44_9HYPH|nr:phage tail assembly chaperone [Hansschlegelia quercus]
MGRGGGGGPQNPFPWDALTAFGLGVLKLAPDAFWRATPREMAAALDGVRGRSPAGAPLRKTELERLMARFPD